jgi:hypothetical protein
MTRLDYRAPASGLRDRSAGMSPRRKLAREEY